MQEGKKVSHLGYANRSVGVFDRQRLPGTASDVVDCHVAGLYVQEKRENS
ncbi:hypothetical protein [Acinetobacter baumannii]|nr:hypothetical protein [Acinetobacter baumannii]